KMSSSKGKVIDLSDVLMVYTPEVTRYLFAGTKPNSEFTISFDLDVIKIYEDYDKTERIAWKLENAKDEGTYLWQKRIYEFSQVKTDGNGRPAMPGVQPYQVPFRHLCNLIQIADGDIDKALAGVGDGSSGPTPEQLAALRGRAVCARYWVEECAPEEFRFKLKTAGEDIPPSLSAAEKEAIRALRDKLVARIETFTDDKSCAEAVYRIAEEQGMEGKAMFRAAYQALIGKDQGPRLASFLRSISKERLLGILAAY
ncbi:MAG: lysine--tRNA ligase, partial [Treponema sp.]|nr:lysine--tRNA ligase [Treponema sp.]